MYTKRVYTYMYTVSSNDEKKKTSLDNRIKINVVREYLQPRSETGKND